MKYELKTRILYSWFEEGLKSKAVSVVNGIQLWLSNMGFPITENEIESISYNVRIYTL